MYSYRHPSSVSLQVLCENALTCLELGVIVCASNQLERLLKPHGVLCGAIRGLDAANEGGHFPFRLTGGGRQERLVALVQRAGSDSVSHSQHRDLEERKRNLLSYHIKVFFFFFF